MRIRVIDLLGMLAESVTGRASRRFLANQRMAAVLKAKGYQCRYVFAEAASHTDGRVTRQTLPGALEWLWQG